MNQPDRINNNCNRLWKVWNLIEQLNEAYTLNFTVHLNIYLWLEI